MNILTSLLTAIFLSQNPYGDVANPKDNIVVVSSYNDNFSTLNYILVDTGLQKMLEEKRGITLFAPSDEAFKALGTDEMASLLDPKNESQLKRIILYHVIPEVLTEKDLKERSEVTTIEGLTLKLSEIPSFKDPEKASNGVIYPIDVVLIPKGSEPKGGSFSPYDALRSL